MYLNLDIVRILFQRMTRVNTITGDIECIPLSLPGALDRANEELDTIRFYADLLFYSGLALRGWRSLEGGDGIQSGSQIFSLTDSASPFVVASAADESWESVSRRLYQRLECSALKSGLLPPGSVALAS